MVKIFGKEFINLKKRVLISLTYIYGIGISTSKKLCNICYINLSRNIENLKNSEIICLEKNINKYLLEDRLRINVRLNIKKLIDLKCYRGLRHINNLPVRGQRTRTNARTRKGPKKIFFNKNEFKKF